jgi:hypothetical protein
MKPAFLRLVVTVFMLAGAASVLGAQSRTITVSVAARALARGDTLKKTPHAGIRPVRAINRRSQQGTRFDGHFFSSFVPQRSSSRRVV